MFKSIAAAAGCLLLGGFLVYAEFYEPYVAMAAGQPFEQGRFGVKAQIFGTLLVIGAPAYLLIMMSGEPKVRDGKLVTGPTWPIYLGLVIAAIALAAAIYLPFFWFPAVMKSFGYEHDFL